MQARIAHSRASSVVLSPLVAVAIAGLLLVGGRASAMSGTTTSHATHVTQADSGRRFVMHVGDHLVVKLTGPAIYTWSEPTASHPTVLQRKSGSSGSAASATFVAITTGRSAVAATDNPNCYPQCLPPSRLFRITVRVLA
jgi:hypothetical protein